MDGCQLDVSQAITLSRTKLAADLKAYTGRAARHKGDLQRGQQSHKLSTVTLLCACAHARATSTCPEAYLSAQNVCSKGAVVHARKLR